MIRNIIGFFFSKSKGREEEYLIIEDMHLINNFNKQDVDSKENNDEDPPIGI